MDNYGTGDSSTETSLDKSRFKCNRKCIVSTAIRKQIIQLVILHSHTVCVICFYFREKLSIKESGGIAVVSQGESLYREAQYSLKELE